MVASRNIYLPQHFSIAERLAARSIPEPNSGCLLWLGAMNKRGYGNIGLKGKVYIAHRIAWAEKHGPVPAGMCVCHKCDVRLCINVDHLWIGTVADNNRDKEEKGRAVVLRGEQVGTSALTASEVIAIRAASGTSRQVGLGFGVTASAVEHIRSRRSWAHLPEPEAG